MNQGHSIHIVPSGAKRVGARARTGEKLQRTLWEEGVHPGGQLPTRMEIEMEAGIAATSLGLGLTALGWAETGSWAMNRGGAQHPVQVIWCPEGPDRLFLWLYATFFALGTCGCNQLTL